MKKLIIVFPDPWLSYSPTVINLAIEASRLAEVHVIGVDESRYLADTFNEHDRITVHFVEPAPNTVAHRVVRKMERLIIRAILSLPGVSSSPKWRELFVERTVDTYIRYRRLRDLINRIATPTDVLVGVDNVGVLAATSLGREVHAVSLEIGKNVFYYLINWSRVASLVTQTHERKNYWLPESKRDLRTFLVQNSPPYSGDGGFVAPDVCRRHIVYMGYLAIEYNALDKLIEALYLLPSDYRLTLKGPADVGAERRLTTKFADLYATGRFAFDHSYVESAHLQDFLSRFSVGATFYDLSTLPYENFNVISCPSGKLFNYFNAGIPVIGNNILGLRPVDEFCAGVLIDEISAQAICDAVLDAERRYAEYSANARRAAKAVDFNERVEPFLRYALAPA